MGEGFVAAVDRLLLLENQYIARSAFKEWQHRKQPWFGCLVTATSTELVNNRAALMCVVYSTPQAL
jgi:hypothetical protein